MTNLSFDHDGPRPPFGSEQLSALEEQRGGELPAGYREFLLDHNGGTPNNGYFKAPHHPGNTWVDHFLPIDKHLTIPTERTDVTSVAFMHQAFKNLIPDDSLIIGVVARDNLLLMRFRGTRRGQVDLKVMDELGLPRARSEWGKDKELGVHPVSKSFSAFLEMLHEDEG